MSEKPPVPPVPRATRVLIVLSNAIWVALVVLLLWHSVVAQLLVLVCFTAFAVFLQWRVASRSATKIPFWALHRQLFTVKDPQSPEGEKVLAENAERLTVVDPRFSVQNFQKWQAGDFASLDGRTAVLLLAHASRNLPGAVVQREAVQEDGWFLLRVNLQGGQQVGFLYPVAADEAASVQAAAQAFRSVFSGVPFFVLNVHDWTPSTLGLPPLDVATQQVWVLNAEAVQAFVTDCYRSPLPDGLKSVVVHLQALSAGDL